MIEVRLLDVAVSAPDHRPSDVSAVVVMNVVGTTVGDDAVRLALHPEQRWALVPMGPQAK